MCNHSGFSPTEAKDQSRCSVTCFQAGSCFPNKAIPWLEAGLGREVNLMPMLAKVTLKTELS